VEKHELSKIDFDVIDDAFTLTDRLGSQGSVGLVQDGGVPRDGSAEASPIE
jgi:hypothetical protein